MSRQLIKLLRPLTSEEANAIDRIVRLKGLKKGAFFIQAIQDKIVKDKAELMI